MLLVVYTKPKGLHGVGNQKSFLFRTELLCKNKKNGMNENENPNYVCDVQCWCQWLILAWFLHHELWPNKNHSRINYVLTKCKQGCVRDSNSVPKFELKYEMEYRIALQIEMRGNELMNWNSK